MKSLLLVGQVKMFLPMIIMYGFNKYGSDWRMDHIRIAYGASQVGGRLPQDDPLRMSFVQTSFCMKESASRSSRRLVCR